MNVDGIWYWPLEIHLSSELELQSEVILGMSVGQSVSLGLQGELAAMLRELFSEPLGR